ncbi:DoxX family protein [Streptomyces beijiangensis]|uniref:DoxX family protein n=1 Tax=Streptomyces beijiangensis TaxID=163361 RepID=A0A939F6G3_9ACTN|nr:DoxX family protein [Streptomyces beijiangensis]MBO0511275.1 DoxX family protein [Streptomyces beijiangensis]
MYIAFAVVAALTIAANAFEAVANIARARFVVANATEVGVPVSWLPMLGSLKGAGAIGLLLGLLGVPLVGVAASIGLVLFFIGAVAAHVRARVFYNIAFPGTFLALAIATLGLVLTVDR